MDIREYDFDRPAAARHFWEQAKLAFVLAMLAPELPNATRLLDPGCGDAFIGRELCRTGFRGQYLGIDPAMTEEHAAALRRAFPETVTADFAPSLESLPDAPPADLVIMLDLLEHIENEDDFLTELFQRTAPGAPVLVTVPAFPGLYTEHDRVLGHFRRYRRKPLAALLNRNGFEVIADGYFFFSLLPVRWLEKTVGKFVRSSRRGAALLPPPERYGIFNRFFAAWLRCDLWFGAAARRIGIQLPGLSCFALCRRSTPAAERRNSSSTAPSPI